MPLLQESLSSNFKLEVCSESPEGSHTPGAGQRGALTLTLRGEPSGQPRAPAGSRLTKHVLGT